MHPRKLPTLSALLVAMLFPVREASASDDGSKSQAIYVHPVQALVTAGIDSIPTYVSVTWERELGHGRSFTLQPTAIFGSVKNNHIDAPKYSTGGLQLAAAYRLYFNGQASEGYYFAPAIELVYLSVSRGAYIDRYDDAYPSASATGKGIGFAGFFGHRSKWENFTLYYDIGAGWQSVSASGNNGYTVSKSGLLLDANLGLGIPF